MVHFPLLLIVPSDICHHGKVSIYNYITDTMRHISDRYIIGGQWNLCFAKSLSVADYVDIEMGFVSTLKYNIVSVAEFMRNKNINAMIIDKNVKLHSVYEQDNILLTSVDDYIVIIDCHSCVE